MRGNLSVMCNRFAFASSPEELIEMRETLGLVDIDANLLTARFNIAPTQQIPMVRTTDASRELAMVRWSLIPSWHKPGEKFQFLTNARSETVATKPSFRSPFKKKRCIIPATGFYEWRTEGKTKYPFFIRLKRGLMPFAGLWERWESPDGPVESAAIITIDANEMMSQLHDRMPCILTPDQFARWLDPKTQDPADLQPMLQQYPSEKMECWPVSQRVNSVKGGNDAGLIERVEA
jgi:putative SOS response-associated peptidase YedK